MKVSSYARVGRWLLAGFAVLAVSVGGSATVRADIIATFTSPTSHDYVYTGGTSESTLTTDPSPLAGFVVYGSNFYNVGPFNATITLNDVKSTTAASGSTQDGWSGSYTITEGSHLVTVSFTNAVMTVTGDAVSLQGDATITANFGSTILAPQSFSLSLSGASPTPSLGSFGFTDFTAGDVSTTSATVVPEPSTLAIVGLGAMGLAGIGIASRRRKRA